MIDKLKLEQVRYVSSIDRLPLEKTVNHKEKRKGDRDDSQPSRRFRRETVKNVNEENTGIFESLGGRVLNKDKNQETNKS